MSVIECGHLVLSGLIYLLSYRAKRATVSASSISTSRTLRNRSLADIVSLSRSMPVYEHIADSVRLELQA